MFTKPSSNEAGFFAMESSLQLHRLRHLLEVELLRESRCVEPCRPGRARVMEREAIVRAIAHWIDPRLGGRSR